MVTKTKKIVSGVTLSLLLSSTLLAQPNHEELAKSIIQLRGDVEALYTQIKENKQQYNTVMKSLSMQIIDSEAQINRKTTSLKLARQKLNEIQKKIASTANSNQEIEPLVYEAIALLEQTIQSGLPFMVDSRIDSLRKIEKDLKDKLITNEQALALVWSNYDDTIRITKEIGLFKQNIELEGKTVLAQVAKLGSIALFFNTPKDEVGFVIKTDKGYSYKKITDPKDREKIVALFDALKKQIRTGFFSLPNALVLQKGVK